MTSKDSDLPNNSVVCPESDRLLTGKSGRGTGQEAT